MTLCTFHNNTIRLDSKVSEIVLIRDFKKGNAKAFENLFEIYHKRLYAFTYSLTKSKEDSEEIVQNAFIKVWENKAYYKEEYPFEAYLFKIAKNTFLNHNRKQVNRRIFEDHFKLFAELTDNSADRQLLFKETQLIVDALINSMPPKRKEVFVLQKIEGFTRKEISEKLNISNATIDSHLQKASKQLLEGLKKFSLISILLPFW